MQKIHRRKNEEIVKDFVCSHDCGKAYGSYAALYTHIKNKHPNAGTYSQIKSIMVKPKATGRKGRPLKKEKQEVINTEAQQDYQCKICQEEQCFCDDEMANQQIQRSINIMQDSKFVELINCVGAMSSSDTFSWVRNSEEEYNLISIDQVKRMLQQFTNGYSLNKIIRISERWLEFLSFSSRYWDKSHISQLFNTIFLIKAYDSIEDIRIFLNNHLEFQNMRKCAELKVKEFNDLIEVIRSD